ncbi:MAG: HlyD family efflux transporter periplasmic adaptor subunit [Bacteroidaceae bacterium]|nr:HlyD family efflux transporter periplasmic adaptor subunit [Bacteroidaceae bacterium]
MDIKIQRPKGFQLRKHWIYVAAGLVLVIIVAWIVWGNHSATLKVVESDITIGEVKRGDFKEYVRTSGRVVPIEIVFVSPEEGGIVIEKVAEEGAMVKRGDVIVRLSNSALDLQILNAEAELAEKQNLLRNTQITMQQDRLSNMTEQTQLDMDIKRKRRTYEQNTRLYNDNLISHEEYLQSKEDYELAQRKYQLVGSRLQQDSIFRTVQMEQMEDNLTNMRKNVTLVRQRNSKLEVRSSIDGELGQLDVALGQSVAAGTKIGQINDLSDFKIQAELPEQYIDRIVLGQQASFVHNDQKYHLAVRKVYPEVKEGKFKTEFKFVGERPAQIRSGQTYYVNLELSEAQQSVFIPRGTFFQTTGGNWIFVLDKNGKVAYRRNIKVGRQNPAYYEVTEGLEPGEKVVISGYEAFDKFERLEIK